MNSYLVTRYLYVEVVEEHVLEATSGKEAAELAEELGEGEWDSEYFQDRHTRLVRVAAHDDVFRVQGVIYWRHIIDDRCIAESEPVESFCLLSPKGWCHS